MAQCPSCRGPLESTHLGATIFEVCPRCGGSLIPLAAARLAIRRDVEERLITYVRTTRVEGTRNCPHCERRMTLVTVPRGPSPVTLNVCEPCGSVWFDAREYEVLKALYGEEQEPAHTLDHKWKWAVAVLGMPVEREHSALLNRPWLTWALSGFITLVSLTAWYAPQLLDQFSLIPALVWRWGGLTLLTSFFLHGGIVHLLSNLYFLLVFGERVEDFLGRKRYLVLLLLATLAGNLLHIAFDPASTRPVVGASGGISGLVVFYGLQFPRAHLLVLLRSLLFYPLRIHARTALLLWILLQVVGAWAQINGFSDISSLAHLGGGGVGLLAWWVWKTNLKVPRKPLASAPA